MSLFDPGLQNLGSLDTVKGMMWGCVGKGDRFAEVHQRGQETHQRAKNMHGKAIPVLVGGTKCCVPFGAQEGKPAGITAHRVFS